MSKVIFSLGSFVAGSFGTLFFFILFGNQTSTLAQAPATKGFVVADAEPVVPPLRFGPDISSGQILNGVTQPLDGFACANCEFKDVTFTYAGGASAIVNPKFSGSIRITFKGAAANTLATVAFLQAILQNDKPPAYNPNAPIIKKAVAKEVFSADLVTPYGQK